MEDVMIRNLDTGEAMPLSCAEEFIPKGTDPISLHLKTINSEYTRYIAVCVSIDVSFAV